MKLKSTFVALAVIITSVLIGCNYNNEEELYSKNGGENCDTLNITYEAHISKIVSESCVSCHGPNYASLGGGYRLDNYEDLKKSIFEVIKAIERSDPIYSPMPLGAPKLSDCKINQFKIWERNGFPEN